MFLKSSDPTPQIETFNRYKNKPATILAPAQGYGRAYQLPYPRARPVIPYVFAEMFNTQEMCSSFRLAKNNDQDLAIEDLQLSSQIHQNLM